MKYAKLSKIILSTIFLGFIALMQANPALVATTNNGRILVSKDDGITWSEPNPGNAVMQSVTIAPDGCLFGINNVRGYRSCDGGMSWWAHPSKHLRDVSVVTGNITDTNRLVTLEIDSAEHGYKHLNNSRYYNWGDNSQSANSEIPSFGLWPRYGQINMQDYSAHTLIYFDQGYRMHRIIAVPNTASYAANDADGEFFFAIYDGRLNLYYFNGKHSPTLVQNFIDNHYNGNRFSIKHLAVESGGGLWAVTGNNHVYRMYSEDAALLANKVRECWIKHVPNASILDHNDIRWRETGNILMQFITVAQDGTVWGIGPEQNNVTTLYKSTAGGWAVVNNTLNLRWIAASPNDEFLKSFNTWTACAKSSTVDPTKLPGGGWEKGHTYGCSENCYCTSASNFDINTLPITCENLVKKSGIIEKITAVQKAANAYNADKKNKTNLTAFINAIKDYAIVRGFDPKTVVVDMVSKDCAALCKFIANNIENYKQRCKVTNLVPPITAEQVAKAGFSAATQAAQEFLGAPGKVLDAVFGVIPGADGVTRFVANVRGAVTDAVGGAFKSAGATIKGWFSDRRVKEQITKIDPLESLSLINKLEPVEYRFIPELQKKHNLPGHTGLHAGLIAQDVKNVFPHIVIPSSVKVEDGTAFYQIEYQELIPYLIGAIQTLSKTIAELESNKCVNAM